MPTAPPDVCLTRRQVLVSSLTSLLTIGGCAALFAYGFTLVRLLVDGARQNPEYGVILMFGVALLVVPLTIAVLVFLNVAGEDEQRALVYCAAVVQVVLGGLIFLGVLSAQWMWYAVAIVGGLAAVVTWLTGEADLAGERRLARSANNTTPADQRP